MANKYDEIMERLNARYRHAREEMRPSSPSESQLDKMESDLGYPLPADYREFMRKYSGYGFDKAAFFPLKGGAYEGNHGSIDIFDGVGPVETMSQDDYYGYLLDLGKQWDLLPDSGVRLVRSYADDVEGIAWPKELLPLGESPAGHTVCLALGGLRLGAVFYWMTSSEVFLAADSFDEFMQSLFVNDREQLLPDEHQPV